MSYNLSRHNHRRAEKNEHLRPRVGAWKWKLRFSPRVPLQLPRFIKGSLPALHHDDPCGDAGECVQRVRRIRGSRARQDSHHGAMIRRHSGLNRAVTRSGASQVFEHRTSHQDNHPRSGNFEAHESHPKRKTKNMRISIQLDNWIRPPWFQRQVCNTDEFVKNPRQTSIAKNL